MRQAFRFILRVRGALDALIYRKTTRRRSPPTENERAAMTLMGTDVERIVTGLRDIHEMWASTVSIAIATWLLERQLSGACVVPLILAVGACPGFFPCKLFSLIPSFSWFPGHGVGGIPVQHRSEALDREGPSPASYHGSASAEHEDHQNARVDRCRRPIRREPAPS